MQDAHDSDLLREYARQHSEAAISKIVRRHIGLVYSTALRQAGNPAHAEEITQAVFIILARKAASLRTDTILEAWLYETTRLTTLSFLRTERRRQFREQEAYMQSMIETTGDSVLWNQLAPLLEEAISRLGKTDRKVVVLRFFKGKSVHEVAQALTMNEAAAQRRILRALEKMRTYFSNHGINSTTAAIAETISTNSIQAAPLALAKTVTTAAIAKGAASTSTLTLIKGALKLMAWSKAKTAIVIGVVAILATSTTTVIVKKVAHSNSWVDDPKYWSLNNPPLASYPPVLILRATQFAGQGGLVGNENRFVGRDLAVQELIALAYNYFNQSSQIIFPGDLPPYTSQSGYDLILTLPNDSRKALQDAIAKKFGLIGHTETIMTNVLSERVINPHAPGLNRLSLASLAEQSSMNGGYRSVTVRNQPLNSFLIGNVEQEVGQSVVNETGLTGRYDMHLDWTPQAGETEQNAFKRAMREQLGIELVPTNMPIQMLIVEKVK